MFRKHCGYEIDSQAMGLPQGVKNGLSHIKSFSCLGGVIQVGADADGRRRSGSGLHILETNVRLHLFLTGNVEIVSLDTVTGHIDKITLVIDVERTGSGEILGAFRIPEDEKAVPVDGQIRRVSRRLERPLAELGRYGGNRNTLTDLHGSARTAGETLVEHAGKIGVPGLKTQGVGIGQVVADDVHLF